ncbi:hypothetical protein ACWCPQ_16985 [Nocardia sp. NPDC001965]
MSDRERYIVGHIDGDTFYGDMWEPNDLAASREAALRDVADRNGDGEPGWSAYRLVPVDDVESEPAEPVKGPAMSRIACRFGRDEWQPVPLLDERAVFPLDPCYWTDQQNRKRLWLTLADGTGCTFLSACGGTAVPEALMIESISPRCGKHAASERCPQLDGWRGFTHQEGSSA